jgi:hypothetical protein
LSLFDFQQAQGLASRRFSALVMAAMMSGREDQVQRLRRSFPELAQELDTRRRSPSGETSAELSIREFEEPRRT